MKATEKESETSKQESQSSEKTESESDDDADADADKETEIEENDSKDSKAVLESNPINNFTTEKDVSQVSIKQNAFSDKFDIWSKNKNDDAVTIVEGKTNSGGLTSFDDLEENYYSSYHTGAGQKSTVIMYDKGYGGITNDKISIYYDNVGEHTDASGVGTMGAVVEISNIKTAAEPTWSSFGKRFIDIPNNLYSGVTYGCIGEFNIDITFVDPKSNAKLNVDSQNEDLNSFLTFGSLNGARSIGNEWAGSTDGVQGNYGKLVKEKIEGNNYMYEGIGEGIWDQSQSHAGDTQWGDYLGSVDFEDGAVSFPLKSQTTHKFMLRSDYGFVWQSIASGSLKPVQQQSPSKTVTETETPNVGDTKDNELDFSVEGQENRTVNDIKDYYYYIYQRTYHLPDNSIAKPNNIIMTDVLPYGVTVNFDENMEKDEVKEEEEGIYNSNTEDVKLFGTDGKVISLDTGGQVWVEKVTINGQKRQKITYTLSDAQITALDFNGQDFSWQIKINHDEELAVSPAFEMINEANVEFNSGKD